MTPDNRDRLTEARTVAQGTAGLLDALAVQAESAPIEPGALHVLAQAAYKMAGLLDDIETEPREGSQ